MLIIYRTSTNRTSLVRDGQLVQGPQAWITSFARNFALIAHSALAGSDGVYGGAIDWNQLVTSFSVAGSDGSRVSAIPWEDTLDLGSDASFRQQLAECQAKMEHLAMHTPRHFLHVGLKRKHSDEGEDEVAARADIGWLF